MYLLTYKFFLFGSDDWDFLEVGVKTRVPEER